MTATAPEKITYTSASGDLDAFHRQFDAALAAVKATAGQRYPCFIAGRPVESPSEPLVDRSPIDTSFVLAMFACANRGTWTRRRGPRRRLSGDGPGFPGGNGWPRCARRRGSSANANTSSRRSWRSRSARAGSNRWATPRSRPI